MTLYSYFSISISVYVRNKGTFLLTQIINFRVRTSGRTPDHAFTSDWTANSCDVKRRTFASAFGA